MGGKNRGDDDRHGGTLRTVVRVLVVPLAFGMVVVIGSCGTKEMVPVMPPAPVLVAKVIQKDMPVDISAIGTVEAYKAISLYPQVTGPVIGVHFREGQDIRKGQALFSIDPAPYRENLRQAEGQLARDEATLKYHEAEVRRYRFLLEKGAVSQADYDQVKANYDQASANVKTAVAQVERTRLDLAYCTIAAPFSGRTGTLNVNLGAVVKANDTLLTTLNQMMPIYVKFSLPEKHVTEVRNRFQTGAIPVLVPTTASQGVPIKKGHLVFIDNTVDTASGMIALKGEFDNRDLSLWPGQFVPVVLRLSMQQSAVVVPVRAVQRSDKGTYVVVVKPDMTAEVRPVTLDRSAGEEAVISQGLVSGETVITDGHLKVRPGAQVEIKTSLESTGPTAGTGNNKTPGATK